MFFKGVPRALGTIEFAVDELVKNRFVPVGLLAWKFRWKDVYQLQRLKCLWTSGWRAELRNSLHLFSTSSAQCYWIIWTSCGAVYVLVGAQRTKRVLQLRAWQEKEWKNEGGQCVSLEPFKSIAGTANIVQQNFCPERFKCRLHCSEYIILR